MAISLPSFSEHRIPTAQGRLYVRDYAGKGDAMVVMHGFPDNQRVYDSLIPYLVDAGRRVIAFDFLGYGDSDRPTGAVYSFAQQLADLEAVADGLQLDSFVPVAHDASGPAALNYALAHPARVSAITLLNCLYAAGPSIRVPELIMLFATDSLKALSSALLHDQAQMRWLLEFQQKKFSDALPEHLRTRFQTTVAPVINENFSGVRNSSDAFAQMTALLLPEVAANTARLGSLSTINVPVKVIWGDHDPYLTSGVARELAGYISHASLNFLPAGHWLQLDMPEETARLMLA
ncbi:alpha/beta hydrolase [Tardiphaga sp. P9-11]|uniref:alpha/beta fold hydrolase n=1 Tax=Tardiphaga sp. P9-11 TaxID=2024614 RepID=UPI0011F29EC8|nr:alpha/beta hydrolase [Tardiphaga sp. P9-11]KAA0069983.1 alpha/beta hydrolase [Tardiphaga sp. P9-11]